MIAACGRIKLIFGCSKCNLAYANWTFSDLRVTKYNSGPNEPANKLSSNSGRQNPGPGKT